MRPGTIVGPPRNNGRGPLNQKAATDVVECILYLCLPYLAYQRKPLAFANLPVAQKSDTRCRTSGLIPRFKLQGTHSTASGSYQCICARLLPCASGNSPGLVLERCAETSNQQAIQLRSQVNSKQQGAPYNYALMNDPLIAAIPAVT